MVLKSNAWIACGLVGLLGSGCAQVYHVPLANLPPGGVPERNEQAEGPPITVQARGGGRVRLDGASLELVTTSGRRPVPYAAGLVIEGDEVVILSEGEAVRVPHVRSLAVEVPQISQTGWVAIWVGVAVGLLGIGVISSPPFNGW